MTTTTTVDKRRRVLYARRRFVVVKRLTRWAESYTMFVIKRNGGTMFDVNVGASTNVNADCLLRVTAKRDDAGVHWDVWFDTSFGNVCVVSGFVRDDMKLTTQSDMIVDIIHDTSAHAHCEHVANAIVATCAPLHNRP